ncbi:MAG: 4-hydroxy-3-methylbut-2-enyl diphosphate reductase [Bacteroidales bacterium]
MKRVELDNGSGFCFGVVNAIKKAEEELAAGDVLYCLGDIVHNSHEVERLNAKGLVTINHEQFKELHHVKVLLRAHGEPPETYEIARQNHIQIIDATCPVVLQLQRKIKKMHADPAEADAQILIFGKNGHAEVNGLVGQTNGEALVIESPEDLKKVNFARNIRMFSQTTKSIDHFQEMIGEIDARLQPQADFRYFDTICRQVANRMPNIREFAAGHDVILFVSGKKSSNGKVLFEECRKVNAHSYLVSDESEIEAGWVTGAGTIGICGATSTPKWLMEKVATYVEQIIGAPGCE